MCKLFINLPRSISFILTSMFKFCDKKDKKKIEGMIQRICKSLR